MFSTLFLYLLFSRTRLGMQIRAGASNREMVAALGVNIRLLYTLVFGLGTMLAALEKQIEEAEDNEIASIVTDARYQAQLTMEQTEQYIEKLRKRLNLQKTKIVNDYINSALKRSYS